MANLKKFKLTKQQLAAIKKGLAGADFTGVKINSIHLSPTIDSVGAAATASNDTCHAVQLPNGHWVIVCD